MTDPGQPVDKNPDNIANLAKSQWFDEEKGNGQYYGWMDMINNFDLGDVDTSYVCNINLHKDTFVQY